MGLIDKIREAWNAPVLNVSPAPRDRPEAQPVNTTTVETLGITAPHIRTDAEAAMRLSAVNRCIEILSDSVGKMPFYVFDSRTRQRVEHPLTDLLGTRPNAWQSPFVFKKMLEAARIAGGNGIAYIKRDSFTMRPTELVPIPVGYYMIHMDPSGIWYQIHNPYTNELLTCRRMDVLHLMAFTRDGFRGISYLERAEEVIRTGRAAQEYAGTYYANGGQPSGILRTDSDLAGSVTVTDANGNTRTISKKDRLREEWERVHSGPSNAQRVAVLDMGLDYKPLSISNRDAQFVEQTSLSVEDIARFFGVPLYKLQAGKQSYSSNEQNAIEYVVGTLHPNATLWEQELSYKLLLPQELEQGLQIRGNLMSELRGDFNARGNWYRTMRETGVFSADDIRALEDLPDVEGGKERYASLNYVPLSLWRELSVQRAKTGTGSSDSEDGEE